MRPDRNSLETSVKDWLPRLSIGWVWPIFALILLMGLSFMALSFAWPTLSWIPLAVLPISIWVAIRWAIWYTSRVRGHVAASDLLERLAAGTLPQIGEYTVWPWRIITAPASTRLVSRAGGTVHLLDTVAANLDWYLGAPRPFFRWSWPLTLFGWMLLFGWPFLLTYMVSQNMLRHGLLVALGPYSVPMSLVPPMLLLLAQLPLFFKRWVWYKVVYEELEARFQQ